MCFVSLHSTGGSALLETPLAYGPRHWGQNRSATGSAASHAEDRRAAPMTAASAAAQILVSVNCWLLDSPIMGRWGAVVNHQGLRSQPASAWLSPRSKELRGWSGGCRRAPPRDHGGGGAAGHRERSLSLASRGFSRGRYDSLRSCSD